MNNLPNLYVVEPICPNGWNKPLNEIDDMMEDTQYTAINEH